MFYVGDGYYGIYKNWEKYFKTKNMRIFMIILQ